MGLIGSRSFSKSNSDITPYVAGHLGLSLLESATLSESGFPSVDMEFEPGFGFGVAAGNDFGPFRVEGELTYCINTK